MPTNPFMLRLIKTENVKYSLELLCTLPVEPHSVPLADLVDDFSLWSATDTRRELQRAEENHGVELRWSDRKRKVALAFRDPTVMIPQRAMLQDYWARVHGAAQQ